MAIDPETVILMSTYRVGFAPPKKDSLTAGELYIQVATPEGGAPWLWVGAMDDATPTLLIPSTADMAPINLDVPYVSQEGVALACTMGNWAGDPDTYGYQWQLDGVDAGSDSETYTITVPDDVGKTATCTVSAANEAGTTVAPPSNPVVIADPAL
jgi:hypothetical protein